MCIRDRHDLDGEVLADVAQEFKIANAADPIEVVQEERGVRALKIQKLPHLLFDARDVPPQRIHICLLYTSPSPRDHTRHRMPSSA